MSIGSKGILAATLLAAAAAPTMAGFTALNNGPEQSLFSIITAEYGAPQAISNAQFNAGAIQSFLTEDGYSFVRLHDNGFANGPTNLHNAYTVASQTTDRRLSDGISQVKFLVKHAGYTNHLGWTENGASAVTGYDYIIGSSGSESETLSADFQLSLHVNGENGGTTYFGSDYAVNGNQDQFVTWYVEGNGRKFWLVAAEDIGINNGGDGDYNDWVGELSVIPLPPAAWAGLSTLAGVGLIGFIRRRRQLA
jgi:hypothetical protein